MLFIAKFPFARQDADEISLEAGERVLVTETDHEFQDGWWMVLSVKG
jgi:hypothetical protein